MIFSIKVSIRRFFLVMNYSAKIVVFFYPKPKSSKHRKRVVKNLIFCFSNSFLSISTSLMFFIKVSKERFLLEEGIADRNIIPMIFCIEILLIRNSQKMLLFFTYIDELSTSIFALTTRSFSYLNVILKKKFHMKICRILSFHQKSNSLKNIQIAGKFDSLGLWNWNFFLTTSFLLSKDPNGKLSFLVN